MAHIMSTTGILTLKVSKNEMENTVEDYISLSVLFIITLNIIVTDNRWR